MDMKTNALRLAAVLFLVMGAFTSIAEEAERLSYNRDIRPILSDKCFSCHGPDNQHREADLRLDVTEDTDDYFGAYFAIQPGAPKQSDFYKRIHSTKSRIVMPPPKSKLTLTDEEKALLERWIKEGAIYEDHWSFVAPSRPDAPEVKDSDWARNPIDAFVLNRLEAKGLKPSKEATQTQLLRRLTLDLTGLPPTAKQIDAFLADNSERAYEKVVDRLLSSEHFGERLALPWLDAARYADTNGFSIDDHRDMWLWREWVIDAFNKNMPYDQFVTEQMAGDLLPNANDRTRLATGFLRNSMNTHEGGTIAEEYRVIYIADKIDTVSTVFMGLTMRCAQCHDHKYDPVSQEDFYRFFAFFDTAHEPGKGATNANTQPVIRMDGVLTDSAAWKAHVQARLATLKSYMIHPPELIEPRAKWEMGAKKDAQGPLAEALNTAAAERTDAHWKSINDAFSKTTRLWGRHLSTIKREVIILENELKAGKPSVMVMKERGPKQTYVLTRGEYDKPDKNQPVSPGVPAVLPSLDFSPKAPQQDQPEKQSKPVNPWLNAKWLWDNPNAARADQGNAPRYFRFVLELKEKPEQAVLRATADNACTTYLNGKKLGSNDPWMTPAQYDVAKHLVKGKNVIAIEAVNAGGAAGLLASLVIDDKQVFGTDKNWKVSKTAQGNWTAFDFDDKQWAAASELGPASMGPWKIGPKHASPSQPDSSKPNRLDLAKWLVDPANPLTARVAVNRHWQMLFGRGLVSTPNDFGAQGAFPSHPELLDWLAVDFVESGWDTKRLIKAMVMSATYRQSSSTTRQAIEQDPYNELLARASRFRLPAELIRDGALAISGKLDQQIGGPSVYPGQPHGLWREVSHFGYGNAFTAQAFYPSDDSGLTRRSMYTFWKRTSPPPSLSAFDAPSREVCNVWRSRTNTPLQALVLLNDPEYVGAAKALAERSVGQGLKAEQTLDYMFRRATGRLPDDTERSLLLEHVKSALQRFKNDIDAAHDLTGTDSPALAAWTSVASVILNLDQTITRE